MVKARKPGRPLGSHQKCWLWGRHAVMETLRAGRWPVLELHLARTLPEAERAEAEALAREHGAPVKVQSPGRLEQLGHSPAHQGYLAKMAEFPYADAARLLEARPADALYLVLDRMQDPHNFGAILRSSEVFGADAVFIGTREQVGVTTAVARASSGAVNRVPVAQVELLTDLVHEIKARGVAVVGASTPADRTITDHDFRPATAVVIGSEAHGLSDVLLAETDSLLSIPQHGAIGSLNAAAAAAVFLYEARRQRPTP